MRRLGLTVVCAWVWCLIVGCASSVGGTAVPAGRGSSAPPPPPKPTVAGAELPKLVLPLDEIKDIMKSPDMVTQQSWTQPDAADAPVEPKECLGNMFGGEAASYNGTGFTAFYAVRQGSPHYVPDVDEAMATFQNAAAAKNFVSKSVAQWRKCVGKPFVEKWPDGSVIPWKLNEPAESGGMATVRNTAVLSPDLAMVRVVAAKSNVIVDLQIEGIRMGDEPTTIAKRILDRVPG